MPDSGSSDRRPGGVIDDDSVDDDPQLTTCRRRRWLWWWRSVAESSVELHGETTASSSSSAELELPVSDDWSDNHVKLDDLLHAGDVCVAASRAPPPPASPCRSNYWKRERDKTGLRKTLIHWIQRKPYRLLACIIRS